jgi:hypothetical protein
MVSISEGGNQSAGAAEAAEENRRANAAKARSGVMEMIVVGLTCRSKAEVELLDQPSRRLGLVVGVDHQVI